MTSFEGLAIAYFVAVSVTGWHSKHWRRGCLYAAGAVTLVIVARFALSWEARVWMPHLYLVIGYWIPAAFTPSPENDRFERWLARADARLAQWGGWGSSTQAPHRRNSSALELAYLLCYPMVPATFALVLACGSPGDVNRYWLAVLIAGFACYGTLRWTAARPPRVVQRLQTFGSIGAANAYVLARASHQLNTFPSGHVAVSIAAAFAAGRVSTPASAGFGVVAVAIAVAAVAGRYHYAVDVLLGVILGIASALVLLLP